jgi:hypothetical protein
VTNERRGIDFLLAQIPEKQATRTRSKNYRGQDQQMVNLFVRDLVAIGAVEIGENISLLPLR